MTADGAIVGTPEYMAPEQVLGIKPDVRVDIYAVGVVLYEMLSGERAFFAKSVREILSGVMNKRLRPLREVRRDCPRSFEKLVIRAMARDPKNRFQTAAELQEALCQVKDELAAFARAAQRQAMESGTEWEPPTARITSFKRPMRESSTDPMGHAARPGGHDAPRTPPPPPRHEPRPLRVSTSAPTPRLPIPMHPPIRPSH